MATRAFTIGKVINSNTPEMAAQQYTSMVLERALVARVADAPAFVQMFPSSEVTPSVLAPGIRPAMLFGARESGTLQPPASRPAAGKRTARSAPPPAE